MVAPGCHERGAHRHGASARRAPRGAPLRPELLQRLAEQLLEDVLALGHVDLELDRAARLPRFALGDLVSAPAAG